MVSRQQLKENWPIWVAGLALGLVIVARIAYAPLASNLDWNAARVNYWLMIFTGNYTLYVVLLVLVLSLISLVGLRFVPKRRTLPIISMFMVANLCACGNFLLTSSLFQFEVDSFHHIDSVFFQDHIYHLTHIMTIQDGGDVLQATYVIYECDETGVYCGSINEFDNRGRWTGNEIRASLVLDNSQNALFVKLNDNLTLIRPKADR